MQPILSQMLKPFNNDSVCTNPPIYLYNLHYNKNNYKYQHNFAQKDKKIFKTF